MPATIASITQDLSDSRGFQKYFGGAGEKAEAAEVMWDEAEARGVYPVVPIMDFTTGDVTQIVYAFSIQDGALTDAAVDTIVQRASALTDEQIGAEDRNYTIGFEPLIAPVGHPANKRGDAPALVPHLADGIEGVRTFLYSSLLLDSPAAVVLYIRRDGTDHIKVVEARDL